MKAETRPDDGVLYWDYILIYVDEILCVHHDPGSPMANMYEYLKMKEGSIQVPTFFLGTNLKKTALPNGVVSWGMSSSKYVQFTVQNVKEYLVALLELLPLPQPPLRARTGGRTDKSKRPESHPTKEFALARVRCLRAEPNYYYCPITLLMS
jgi:hypothetical protein